MVSRYTTLVPPLGLCIGPAMWQALALVREGARASLQERESV